MATHPSLRPETGVARGPERFGSTVVDPARDQLRDELRRFEALADPKDEAQMQARTLGWGRGRRVTSRGPRPLPSSARLTRSGAPCRR